MTECEEKTLSCQRAVIEHFGPSFCSSEPSLFPRCFDRWTEQFLIFINRIVQRFGTILNHRECHRRIAAWANDKMVDNKTQCSSKLFLSGDRWKRHRPQLDLLLRTRHIANPPRNELNRYPTCSIFGGLKLSVCPRLIF